MNPDTVSGFKSRHDVLARLLPYHIFAEPEPPQAAVEKGLCTTPLCVVVMVFVLLCVCVCAYMWTGINDMYYTDYARGDNMCCYAVYLPKTTDLIIATDFFVSDMIFTRNAKC